MVAVIPYHIQLVLRSIEKLLPEGRKEGAITSERLLLLLYQAFGVCKSKKGVVSGSKSMTETESESEGSEGYRFPPTLFLFPLCVNLLKVIGSTSGSGSANLRPQFQSLTRWVLSGKHGGLLDGGRKVGRSRSVSVASTYIRSERSSDSASNSDYASVASVNQP